jgi:hypothetical protein
VYVLQMCGMVAYSSSVWQLVHAWAQAPALFWPCRGLIISYLANPGRLSPPPHGERETGSGCCHCRRYFLSTVHFCSCFSYYYQVSIHLTHLSIFVHLLHSHLSPSFKSDTSLSLLPVSLSATLTAIEFGCRAHFHLHHHFLRTNRHHNARS